jgi:hypothetical protein
MAEIPRTLYGQVVVTNQPLPPAAQYPPAVLPPPPGPSLATQLVPPSNKFTGLLAGEQIFQGDACYISGTDGLVHRSTGAAAGPASAVDGFAPIAAPSGEAITLLHGIVFQYPSTLAAGAYVYLSGANAGGLADAASVGGTVPVGKVIDANRIYLKRSW